MIYNRINNPVISKNFQAIHLHNNFRNQKNHTKTDYFVLDSMMV